MAKVGESLLEMNSPEELKIMFKTLFQEKYYPSTLQLQKNNGLLIRLKDADGTSNADLEERILKDVSNGQLSTLVLGDSGTGKSWLALNLTKELYGSTLPKFKNKIPIYIPLGRVEKMVNQQKRCKSPYRSDILFCYIMCNRNRFRKQYPLEQLENLYLDLCACDLILILDGYDELKVDSDWWEHTSWMECPNFKDVPRIVSCRPNALVGVDLSKMFGFSEEPPCTYVISKLEGNIVKEYIRQVPKFLRSIQYDSTVNDPWMMTKSITKDYAKWESAKKDSEYEHWFVVKLPELQGLAQNVFILTIICQLLPELVETERAASKNDVAYEFMRKLKQICRTEVLLYDRFTETWFKYQVKRKIESTGHMHILYQNQGTLHHYMRAYAQNLAMRCAQLDREMVSNGEISEGETLFWNLWTPWSPNSEKLRNNSIVEELFPQNENDTNEGRLENLKFLRDSCLLRYDSSNKIYGFLHLSIFEYFLSRVVFEVYRGALNYYSNWNLTLREEGYFLISQNNINDAKFSGVLSMLVGRAKTDENFQATLLEAIKMSATLPGIARMASNAITILNLSAYSFSGRNKEDDNFQNIQVPGANLRNSICGNSDFSGANFENAKLNQGWFQRCKFQGANFFNCSLGQIPPISLKLENVVVHDVLCCTIDGFDHVIICCVQKSPTERITHLYVKKYKLQANFEFEEGKKIFSRKMPQKIQYIFRLVELPQRIILFVFVHCVVDFLNERIRIKRPDSWFEFRSNSCVNSGKFKQTELSLQRHLEQEVFKERNSTQKFIMFFRDNKLPEFCNKETLESVDRTNRCWIKFILIPFGPFKFLVSVYYGDIRRADRVRLDDNINRVSLFHNGMLILCNDESVSLEIFWQFNNCSADGMQEKFLFQKISIQCLGPYFDDNVILSIPSTVKTYFFDLKNEKVLNVLENTLLTDSISNYISTTSENIASTISMDLPGKVMTKLQFSVRGTNTARFVSKNFDFIALKNIDSIDVFSVENGTVSQNVRKDDITPITFKCSNGSTYLVYVFNRSLQFERLEAIELVAKKNTAKEPVGKYFSEDGSLCVVSFVISPSGAIFDILKFHNESGGPAWKEVFDNRVLYTGNMPSQKKKVLITPSKFVVFYFCLSEPQLNGYDTERRQKFDIKDIQRDRLSKDTEIFMVQEFQKIVFISNKEFACYSVTEIGSGDKRGLQLVNDITFPHNFQYSSTYDIKFVFDPNENRSYMFDEKITKHGLILVWNLENNTYGTFSVKNATFELTGISLCTVLLKTNIIQGYCKGNCFYIKRTNEYSRLHAESPMQVSSSSKLGWIVARFRSGDLLILESKTLDRLFCFGGFQSWHKFQITLQSPDQVCIALVGDFFGELVWLSINAVTLRKYYEERKVEEFRDWKVNKSEVPSSSLSLSEVDISGSRSVDKRFGTLFKSHGSRGSPSETDAYKPFCNLFVPVTDYPHSILITSDNQQRTDLTQKWTVTVIAKKPEFKKRRGTVHALIDQHTALIIEGMLHGGHFVIKAELTQKNKVVKIKCESLIWKSKYEEICKKYNGKEYQVQLDIGMKLLKNIWADTYNIQWRYKLGHHNCNTWCKEKLLVLGISEDEFESKLYNGFVDLPKDFKLKKFKFIT